MLTERMIQLKNKTLKHQPDHKQEQQQSMMATQPESRERIDKGQGRHRQSKETIYEQALNQFLTAPLHFDAPNTTENTAGEDPEAQIPESDTSS